MVTYSLTVNGQNKAVAVDGETPLLWKLHRVHCVVDCGIALNPAND